MIKHIADCAELNNGIKMPWLGLGVYQLQEGQQIDEAIKHALNVGYRSIDTASAYGNERGAGKAIRECGLPREEIFLTTKVWNSDQREDRVMAAFEESLARLELDYVDLYLVHWPVRERYQETWKVMEEIYHSGRAKAIGVSNFQIDHLETILSNSQVVPAVNQIEFHPSLQQPELLAFCKTHNIQVEAWSPLKQGRIVSDPVVQQIGEKYGKTAAQIVLRWDLQHGVVTIPKSSKLHRIEENGEIFDFELSPEDMQALNGLDNGERIGPDPYNFGF